MYCFLTWKKWKFDFTLGTKVKDKLIWDPSLSNPLRTLKDLRQNKSRQPICPKPALTRTNILYCHLDVSHILSVPTSVHLSGRNSVMCSYLNQYFPWTAALRMTSLKTWTTTIPHMPVDGLFDSHGVELYKAILQTSARGNTGWHYKNFMK